LRGRHRRHRPGQGPHGEPREQSTHRGHLGWDQGGAVPPTLVRYASIADSILYRNRAPELLTVLYSR
jgi:hypothetical protein